MQNAGQSRAAGKLPAYVNLAVFLVRAMRCSGSLQTSSSSLASSSFNLLSDTVHLASSHAAAVPTAPWLSMPPQSSPQYSAPLSASNVHS